MTLRLGGDGAITGCTSLENPDLTVSGLTISGSFDAERVLVASGTAAAPSYTFSGDTDNGLYYAGTNSIGVSTAGTSAIVVDSNGDVGIGTTSPSTYSSKLVVADGSVGGETALVITNNSANQFVRLGINADEAQLVWDNADSCVFGTTSTASDPGISSEAMRIDTDGRLLVGTSSDISGGTISTAIQLVTTVGSFVGLGRNDTTVGTGNSIGGLRFYANDPSGYNQVGRIECKAAGSHSSGDYPTSLHFYTTEDNTDSVRERMVIDETGRVRVGNHASYIASTGVFQVANTSGTIVSYVNSESLSDGEHAAVYSRGENTSNVARQGAIGVYKNPSLTNTVGYIFMDQEDGGNSYLWVDNSGILRISGTGTHRGTTSGTVVGTQTSDERLKNIGNTVAYGLAEIKQLQPKQYSLKTDPGTNKLGFIAQEVESIIPEAVFDTKEELEGHEDGDRTKLGMEYVQLIPVLVNAVKELSAENDALKQRLADAGL